MELPQFDTTRIKSLIMSRKEGWNESRFNAALGEYRKFLFLCSREPEKETMAPEDVDEVWHMHMLDSVNYQKDCERIFGGYLHHDPCVQAPNPENIRDTLARYENTFGTMPTSDWLGMMTCAGPGKGCGSIRCN